MTRPFRILTLQASVLGASGLFMTLASLTNAAPAPASAAVEIGNFTFKKPILIVKPGTTVTWTNGDDIPHTVVSKDGAFRSKVLDSGDKYSFTFAKAGQFGYYCSIHPHMTGTVIVRA